MVLGDVLQELAPQIRRGRENTGGMVFYLCALLDGASRFTVHRELRAQMTEQDVELTLKRAKDGIPRGASASSHNGSQFIAKNLKELTASPS